MIQKRRSVYPSQFTEEKINDDIIWEILNDANNAPSHKNSEPWRFRVYAGKSKEVLQKQLENAYQKYVPEESQKAIKLKKIGSKIQASSHIIVVSRKVFSPPINPDWEEIASIGCAIENIYLSCTMRGLGCYWSTPGYVVDKENILDLPSDEVCLGLVYIGVPDQGKSKTVVKQSIEEKVIWYS
jgi:nitroreductase